MPASSSTPVSPTYPRLLSSVGVPRIIDASDSKEAPLCRTTPPPSWASYILPRCSSDTGLPKSLADLFPGSFEDSELGEIPKGWEVKGLDETARFVNGLALQRYPPKGGRSLPVIKISQLRAGTTENADAASGDLEPDYVVEDGDVLFSWSGSLECVLWAGGKGALNQHLFKVTSVEYPKWFYYLWIHHHLDSFRHIAAGKATTMGHIQRHHLSNAKVISPPSPLLRAMGTGMAPIVEQLWRRPVQSRSLAGHATGSRPFMPETRAPCVARGRGRMAGASGNRGRNASGALQSPFSSVVHGLQRYVHW